MDDHYYDGHMGYSYHPRPVESEKKLLLSMDMDTQPALSPQEVNGDGWLLAVRAYGLLVITSTGVRLQMREELEPGQVSEWGQPFP